MTIKTINIADIQIGKRSRNLDKDAAKQIAESISQVGLMNPITVAETEDGYKLIAGRHRIAAYKINGAETIRADVIKGLSSDEISLRELDENLMRLELSSSEEAEWIAERKRIWEKLNGKKMSLRDTAEKLGKKKDVIHRAINRSKLDPEIIAAVKGTKGDKGQVLDDLVKVAKKEGKAAAVTKAKEAAISGKLTKAEAAANDLAGEMMTHVSALKRLAKKAKSEKIDSTLAAVEKAVMAL